MMKRCALLLFLVCSAIAFSQVRWLTLEEAVRLQHANPKKILIDFYADWCSSCKTMEKHTFSHPVISQYLNEDFYAVKFNAEAKDEIAMFGKTFINSDFKNGKQKNSLHDFTKYMNVNAVPAIVFLDEKAMPITILQGAFTARELEPYLPFIANDQYKKITSREKWEIYQQKFKSKIKD